MCETTTKQRAERVARCQIEANNAVRDALGDVLVRHFPEATTGDERPEDVFALTRASERAVASWVEDNAPALTLEEAVDALRIAHDALGAFHLVQSDSRYDDARAAYGLVQAALKRTGTYENPPRP